MIQSSTKHIEDYKFEFNLVLKKMPSDILKEFALVCLKSKALNKHLSPLHKTAAFCDLLLYKYILEKSSDKNPKDRMGRTPFHSAAFLNNLEVVKFCIANAVYAKGSKYMRVKSHQQDCRRGHNGP